MATPPETTNSFEQPHGSVSNTTFEDATDSPVPPTRSLCIASHVVYGHVGNTMAVLVQSLLGIDACALNTVNFSNHTGYGQFKGTRTPVHDVRDLYEGLKQSYLLDFDVLLSGYIPSAEVLGVVGEIARDLRYRRDGRLRPGGFFWLMDPVMGDQGRLYVAPEMVEGYKALVSEADCVVPNGFELELISGVKIRADGGEQDVGAEEADLEKVRDAIEVLHRRDGVRMVVVTSVRVRGREGVLCVVGSERGCDGRARGFVVEVPALECYFSGTGDMFAGLLVGRLREECAKAGVLEKEGWASEDAVRAEELPLAKATVKVLSSMNAVLEKTMRARNREVAAYEKEGSDSACRANGLEGQDVKEGGVKRKHLLASKAAEVRIVRNVRDLIDPKIRFEAVPL